MTKPSFWSSGRDARKTRRRGRLRHVAQPSPGCEYKPRLAARTSAWSDFVTGALTSFDQL